MNKLTKAAIAAAVGTALLLGGAGTLATWNSVGSVASTGVIVAGNLAVTDDATLGVWKANGTTITLAGYKVVPGDVLTLTKTLNIVATGNNLVATLAVAPGSITASSGAAADIALAAYLTKTAAVTTAIGTGVVLSGSTYTITAGAAGVTQSVTATVSITFPKSGTLGLEDPTMLGSVSLAGVAISLTQN